MPDSVFNSSFLLDSSILEAESTYDELNSISLILGTAITSTDNVPIVTDIPYLYCTNYCFL